MNREDKLLKIIDGLQDTIRKLESERITPTVPVNPFPYPYIKWAHPITCQCWECTGIGTWTFPVTITGTSTDKITIGDGVE